MLHHRTRTARCRGTDKDREQFRLLLLRKTQDGKEGTMTKIIGAHRMLDMDIRTRQATIVARISRAGASTGNTEDRNTVLSITGQLTLMLVAVLIRAAEKRSAKRFLLARNR